MNPYAGLETPGWFEFWLLMFCFVWLIKSVFWYADPGEPFLGSFLKSVRKLFRKFRRPHAL